MLTLQASVLLWCQLAVVAIDRGSYRSFGNLQSVGHLLSRKVFLKVASKHFALIIFRKTSGFVDSLGYLGSKLGALLWCHGCLRGIDSRRHGLSQNLQPLMDLSLVSLKLCPTGGSFFSSELLLFFFGCSA